jgi:hypothetical protein
MWLVLDQLPVWLLVLAGLPWWGRKVIDLLRDFDRYRDERRRGRDA